MPNPIQSLTGSGKLIREWTTSMAVGIWDSVGASIRLYGDRAISKTPYVRWHGNTGVLSSSSTRITGYDLAALLQIAKEEHEDGEDYTDRAFALLAGR